MMPGTNSKARAVVEAECPETWLARRLAAGKPAETWKPVPAWYYEQIGLPVPDEPHEASDQGKIRNAKGEELAQRANGRPKELPPEEQYRRTNLCVAGKKKPVLSSHVVLAAHCPEQRDGRDTRHLGRGRACRTWNWWPEGITYGTQSENEMDKPPEIRSAAAAAARAAQAAAGTAKPPRPTFRCLYWARCGGMVLNEGSRCGTCCAQVGKDAAVLLGLRMPAQSVGEFFGYTDGRRVHDLAVEHGGYQGSAAEARTQRPALWQRVWLMRAKRRIRHQMTKSSGLRNVTGEPGTSGHNLSHSNRTPVTYATNVTGQEGEPGRWLDAVGGDSPTGHGASPVTEGHEPPGSSVSSRSVAGDGL